VCEGVLNDDGRLVPGFIWLASERDVSFVGSSETNWQSFRSLSPYHFITPTAGSTNRSWGGFLSFLSVRGVVTFNDRVLGKDCLFIQNDSAGIYISQEDRRWGDALQVGQWVTFGGNLQPGKYSPSLHPLLSWTLGWRPLPEPVTDPVGTSVAPSRDGQWTELEGVVRSVNTNGTMILMGKGGPVTVWIGNEPTNNLNRYTDSALRLRGVLSLTMQDGPMLLVPSQNFVEVEEQAKDPFKIPLRSIASLNVATTNVQWLHRARIKGAVIYRDERSLFVQDASGGLRVQVMNSTSAQIGDWVELVGFPEEGGPSLALAEALVRITSPGVPLNPPKLNLGDVVADKYNGTLVRVEAYLLAQKTSGSTELLELQQGQRIFEAMLVSGHNRLSSFAAGSLLEITGVCDFELVPRSSAAKSNDESISSVPIRILMRSPADAVQLRSPPRWTWKEAAILTSGVLIILAGALFRIYLSRRRLEKQQAAQFAFSRQILQSQESERRRIAANLHDSLGQSLLVIKNQARLAEQSVSDNGMVQQRLDEISNITSQAIEEVRQITHDLRPYQLDRLGLTQAIRAVIQRVSENSTILFASHVDDIDGLFNQESEIHVYRIVQECLNNIIKHSGAVEAAVVIKKQATAISLSFRDNGRGFDASAAGSSGGLDAGYGLNGIAERARILGGKLSVDSHPGEGADLAVIIPISLSKHET
jgi:signal transduction histidine kinase